MRLGCMMIGGAIACFVFGYKGLSDNLKFRQPVTMTASDFLKKKPQEGWFRITETTIDVSEAKFSVRKPKYSTTTDTSITSASTFYLPVHPKDDLDSKTTLLLRTQAPEMRDLLTEIQELDKQSDENKIREWAQKNESRLIQHPTLTGMVASGIDDDTSDKSKIASLGEELGPDFVILKEGHEPPPAYKSIGLFVLGVVLLPLSLFGFGFRRSAEA